MLVYLYHLQYFIQKNGNIELIEAEWCIYAALISAVIDSDNGLSYSQCQAIIRTNQGLFLAGPLRTSTKYGLEQDNKYPRKQLKVSSVKWRSFCLDLNVLMARHNVDFQAERISNVFHLSKRGLSNRK